MKRSKKYLTAGIGAAVVLVAGGSIYAFASADTGESETTYKETTVEKGNLTVGVTESGSISIGSLSQEIEFMDSTSSSGSGQSAGSSTANSSSSSSTAALEVEEVYVSAGQNVQKGDAILKLTSESVESYRKELTDAVTEAQAAVSEAKLTAAKTKLSASYAYDLSVAKGSVAQDSYDATVSDLEQAVEDAQEAYDESAALVTYYQQMIDEGVDLSDSLEEEQKNCDSLYNKLKAAQSAYTTQSIAAKKEYQESVFSSQNASSQYSADVTGVDIKTEDAEADLEDAKEKLAEFESFVGDGTITSEYDGTIMTVGYEAGDDLSAQTAVVTFADTDEVTMTVSVSEEDITGISIGDEVIVELNAYEGEEFAATVESMDTSVSSGSSTVSYDVEVHLTGDCDGILTDMTGNVTFVSKEVEDVLYVSNKAIIRDGTVSYVKVKKEDGTIVKTEVETGFSDGVNVEITSGLEEGDTVLIESQVKSE